MAVKRKRQSSPQGLPAGQRLKRNTKAGDDWSAWGWVGTEVMDASDITSKHLLASCGLSGARITRLCGCKYLRVPSQPGGSAADGSDDDVIMVSDDGDPECFNKNKNCKKNPFCLNNLGQEKWEREKDARKAFFQRENLSQNPNDLTRQGTSPAGLLNLGATCYANALLQVWFQDTVFRRGVFRCRPSCPEDELENSPLFQLQVTFTALQEGIMKAFNPFRLVKSLELREDEQQDAQEFSKLFMSHLEPEFKKQEEPTLRSLLSNQFQGRLVYGTLCKNCDHRSDRESEFSELEISLANKAKLEDRLAVLLAPEVMGGDNQYLCSHCESLQDAVRSTQLLSLPPVLHISLLRFVYDPTVGERKKSKHSLSFPTVIDMSAFLAKTEAQEMDANDGSADSIYELRGILLHEGTSAHRGHYKAKVYRPTDKCWYEYDDATITKVPDWKPNQGKGKMRIVDSDDEIQEVSGPSNADGQLKARYMVSKDAYMLVYVRKSTSLSRQTAEDYSPAIPQPLTTAAACQPPDRAMAVVQKLNEEHRTSCAEYTIKQAEATQRFEALRHQVMAIYRNWHIDSMDQKYIIVAELVVRQLLENPLTRIAATKEDPKTDETPSEHAVDEKETAQPVEPLLPSGLLCVHGKLDPGRSADFKCIKRAAYPDITAVFGCKLEPVVSPDDICRDCVMSEFHERLYFLRHKEHVHRFDSASEDDPEEENGYWISKNWLKDWRSDRPSMHNPGQSDPPPDDALFLAEVVCEHGHLVVNSNKRRRISIQGYHVLHEIFPGWSPPPLQSEICPVCELNLHSSVENKKQLKERKEKEKKELWHVNENGVRGTTALLEDVPLAIVPTQFINDWRLWIHRPDASRPEVLDNSEFICRHGSLQIDPNAPEDMNSVDVVRRSDWDILTRLYDAGPLIALQNQPQGNGEYRFVHNDYAVCQECCHQRRSEWETCDIALRINASGNNQTETYTPSATGSRKSKRLRSGKNTSRKEKLTISKQMTVKEIKLLIQQQLSMPTIQQRLSFNGQELIDNSVTVADLGILSTEALDLVEVEEDESLLDDCDIIGSSDRRTEGFGGTVLGGRASPASRAEGNAPKLASSAVKDMEIEEPDEEVHECPRCGQFAVYEAGELVCLEQCLLQH